MIWLRLAVAYFAAVFALGFALGVMRTLVVAPLTGETAAVAVELPVMIAASWIVCARLLSRFRLAPGQALAMGLAAILLLIIAEAGISLLLAGRTLAGHLALYREVPHVLGLAGQVVFAIIPWLQTTMLLRHASTGRSRPG